MRVFKDKEEIHKLNKAGHKLAFYGDSIINLKDFKHPGPQDLIDSNIGKDLKDSFLSQNHSEFASSLVKKYTIGNLATPNNFYQPEFATELDEKKELIHKKIDEKLDLKKPILSQIKNFTKEEFFALVERPRFVEGCDNIQIYDSKFEDFFSKSPIILNIISLPIISWYLLYNSLQENQNFKDLSFNEIFSSVFLYIFIIAFIWSFIEYYYHRFLLHPENSENFPQNPKGEELMEAFKRHLLHHTFINQKHRIAIKPFFIFYNIFIADFSLKFFLPVFFLRIILSAIVSGALFYDLLHYYYHFGGEPPFKFLADLKSHHMRHHYRNSKEEYGVTSYFWDWVYGTDNKNLKIL